MRGALVFVILSLASSARAQLTEQGEPGFRLIETARDLGFGGGSTLGLPLTAT